ncbi:hypothetical protein F4810DRAFT_539812 [Camillea tinctor]|nr:hypothetical protein F4810DRAFT_539812 [Camillea tinctor]
MRQTWPSTGEHIIQLVKDVVRSENDHKHTCTLAGNTELTAWIHRSEFMVEVRRTNCSLAEIGEQLAWPGAALRSSPYEHGVAFPTPCINLDTATQRSISATGFCKIDFAIEREEAC